MDFRSPEHRAPPLTLSFKFTLSTAEGSERAPYTVIPVKTGIQKWWGMDFRSPEHRAHPLTLSFKFTLSTAERSERACGSP